MADYGASDTSTTTIGANQFPISDVYVPNTGLRATEGGPVSTDAGGKASAPTSMYVKDGGNVVEGSTTDTAVTGDTGGTHSAKLRGLSKIWADVWDSVNHRLHVNVDAGSITANAGTNLNTSALAVESGGHLANIDTHTPAQGQATKANSSPVVIASDQGDLLIKGDFAEQSGLTAGSLNADLVASTDVSAYKGFSLQVTGTWSGTLTFQGSNDNSNFVTIQVYNLTGNSTGVFTGNTTVNGLFANAVAFRYLRVRMTSYTSGTANGVLELYTQNLLGYGNTSVAAGQSGTWTMQPGNTQNTTPWLVNAQRNTVAVYSLASTVTTGSTQNSGDLTVGPYAELSIDINTTAQAGTSPTIQYFYERKAADGIYYVLWQSAVLTLAANTLSTSIGAGMAYNQSLGATGRLRWVVGGSATPTFTHSLNIQGK